MTARLSIVVSRNGTELLGTFDTDTNPALLTQRSPGIYRYQVHLPTQYLKAGAYSVQVNTGIINRGPIETHRDAATFSIEEITEDTSFKGYSEHRAGVLRIPVLWEVR